MMTNISRNEWIRLLATKCALPDIEKLNRELDVIRHPIIRKYMAKQAGYAIPELIDIILEFLSSMCLTFNEAKEFDSVSITAIGTYFDTGCLDIVEGRPLQILDKNVELSKMEIKYYTSNGVPHITGRDEYDGLYHAVRICSIMYVDKQLLPAIDAYIHSISHQSISH